MKKIITSFPLDNDCREEQFQIELPSKCPNCNIAFGEIPLTNYHINSKFNEEIATVYSLFFCPHCEHCFFVEFEAIEDLFLNLKSAMLIHTHPPYSHLQDFPDSIKTLSPKFVEIYHQSEKAENENLTEICGMGYRKALEFLVKDYAIKFNPDEADNIKHTQLGSCINSYIDNPKLQKLAKASAWIGNDETHFVRKHKDYNLQDLKLFINAILTYIDSELSYLAAEEFLSTRKK